MGRPLLPSVKGKRNWGQPIAGSLLFVHRKREKTGPKRAAALEENVAEGYVKLLKCSKENGKEGKKEKEKGTAK